MTETLGPRIVVAGTHSGVGKTTVATGLLAAFASRDRLAAGAKVGPDFIDPGYHALASGRPPRNLDPWLCGIDAMLPLAGRAGAGTDLLIVEGVMGLFDGAADGSPSSTADVARALDAPVLLVVDVAAMSGSVAALVEGFARHDPTVEVAGLVLNRVGSESHDAMVREALVPTGIPVLGSLPRDDAFTWRDRHLGLVPVVEATDARRSLGRLASAIAERVDLAEMERLAATAPTVEVPPASLPDRVHDGPPVRIGVASGAAFSFTYTDTLDALRAAGAEPVPFDPTADATLPDRLTGVIAGGGFPEEHADALSANRPLLDEVHGAVTAGMPVWAECGGLLWLSRSLDGLPMAGVIPADGSMEDRLTLGYRTAEVRGENPVAPVGSRLRGHEFHYSSLEPAGDALELCGRQGTRPEGHARAHLLATYLHVHPGGDPAPVARFVQRCVPDA